MIDLFPRDLKRHPAHRCPVRPVDSTAMALLLKSAGLETPFVCVCTPTGDELPPMFKHWNDLGERLGRRLVPIMVKDTAGVIRQQRCCPTFAPGSAPAFSKIEPYRKMLIRQAAVARGVLCGPARGRRRPGWRGICRH